ncbi:MAG TPA: SIS domain-containing protein [Anaerolineales bacterium]|jgi:D-sedoheptulose 7-phosphate isomerase|nr:SIS domain-containing protein [Anaerolineales bacterium]
MEFIQEYISTLQLTMDQLPHQLIAEVIDLLQQTRTKGSQVFILGNGGSASTASHFACDLAKNTRQAGLPHFRVIGLTDNMAMFSALANDEGYENVFSEQLASLVRPGDIVIAISASGNSKNVIKAVEAAHRYDATVIGFTGFDGGLLGQLANINIHVNSKIIEHVEDIHLMLEHLIVRSIKAQVQTEANVSAPIAQVPAELFSDSC